LRTIQDESADISSDESSNEREELEEEFDIFINQEEESSSMAVSFSTSLQMVHDEAISTYGKSNYVVSILVGPGHLIHKRQQLDTSGTIKDAKIMEGDVLIFQPLLVTTLKSFIN